MLMLSATSASICFAGDFVPVRQAAPQQPVLLVMAIGVAAGNNLANNAGPIVITHAKPKSQIMPKYQKNSHQKIDRKEQRINQPRKGY